MRAEPVREIIVAGFEPFGRRTVNRSWQAVHALRARPWLMKFLLPVDFARLAETIPLLVARRPAPAAILICGEAAASRRSRLSVERLAVNVLHARIADNGGARPRMAEVVPGAPVGYFATWDAAATVAAITGSGLAAEVSHHAGTFACNAALYLALHAAAGRKGAPRIGFLHVPIRGPSVGALTAALEEVILTLRPAHGTKVRNRT